MANTVDFNVNGEDYSARIPTGPMSDELHEYLFATEKDEVHTMSDGMAPWVQKLIIGMEDVDDFMEQRFFITHKVTPVNFVKVLYRCCGIGAVDIDFLD